MSMRGVVWSICFGLMMISPDILKGETVSIKFEELVEFANRQSSDIQIIKQTYDLTGTERNIDLQWANPEFNYSQEEAAGQMEQYLTLSKQIEMPWVYAGRQQSWKAQLDSAEYKKNERIRLFLSNLKSRYIELKLSGTQLKHLDQLKNLIVNVSDVARDQLKEGTLSGADQHLIQMTLVNINARLQTINQMTRWLESKWKADMGIDASDHLQLLTDIHFQPVKLDTLDNYLLLIPNTPGYRQRELNKMAIQKNIEMERKRLIPHFNLFGGYKKLESDQDGYVAGISIPLPFFNQNRPAIQKKQVELKIANSELKQYQQILRGQIETLVSACHSLEMSLETAESHFNKNQDMIESIRTSYQEGWMSLTEMLNAIQIKADGIQAFYKQLVDYYQSLFQLEAIIGQTLVNFSARKGDK